MTSTSDSAHEQPTDAGPGVSDDQLPEDLQPGEDNPLAEPLPDDVDPADLDLDGGKGAEQSSEQSSEQPGGQPGGQPADGPGEGGAPGR